MQAKAAAAPVATSEATGKTGPMTMFDKIWEKHVVDTGADGTALIYIDRHLVHEVTSPQVRSKHAAQPGKCWVVDSQFATIRKLNGFARIRPGFAMLLDIVQIALLCYTASPAN